MKKESKSRWLRAFEKPSGGTQNEAQHHNPAVQQMRGELRELREETLPVLKKEVDGLKQATREILEILHLPVLRPPEKLELESSCSKMGQSGEERLGEIPGLKTESKARVDEDRIFRIPSKSDTASGTSKRQGSQQGLLPPLQHVNPTPLNEQAQSFPFHSVGPNPHFASPFVKEEENTVSLPNYLDE